MSTPHEYFDSCDNIDIHSCDNDAMYEDVDAFANDSHSSLLTPSTIGRGPRGDCYEATITKQTEDDFEFELRNDRLQDEYIKSPNLHAGKLTVETDPIPINTSDDESVHRGDLLWPGSDYEGQRVHFFLSRGGNKKEIATCILPLGAHGSRIFEVSGTVLTYNPDNTYRIEAENIMPDTPEPRVWDAVFGTVAKETGTYFGFGFVTGVFYYPEHPEQNHITAVIPNLTEIEGGGGSEIVGSKYIDVTNNVVSLKNIGTNADIDNIFG